MDIEFKQFLSEGKYRKKDTEFGDNNDDEVIWSISGRIKEEEKVYTYDEAIELTGNGWYNISLLVTLALVIQAMALDMFGFSYVVAAAACDLQLSHNQISFLLSVPLMGSIISAYFHGYILDMRGRKKCMTDALCASFVVASLSSLSPNFIVLAIFKLFSSSICSGLQSMAYTLLGESCTVRVKESYIMILTSALMCSFAVFTAHAYFVLRLNFTYDLGFITFKPWRLLILTLAITFGFSALFMEYFYESPKFLVSAGRTEEALKILRKIKKRNRSHGSFPVKKIILLETSSTQRRDGSFLKSLWDQTAPLFTPPLLQRTLLLFYIIAVIYSVNNGFFVWFPVIFSKLFETPTDNAADSFCNLVNSHSNQENNDCTSVAGLETLLLGIIQGLSFFIINFCVAKLNKKKSVIIFFSLLASFSNIAMVFTTEKFTTIVFFLGVQLSCMAMGTAFCYFIELFPTCYRGMITSLGVMVARGSALVGVNLVGTYTFTHCTASLYGWAAYTFSGALIALLLPSDTPKK